MGILGWLNTPTRDGRPPHALSELPSRQAATADASPQTLADTHGHQSGHDETLAIVDGEIRWQRAHLARLARDRGQAAALVEAWREHRTGLFEHARGHFAFALLAPAAGTALLGVDRSGTRPLAFARVAGDGLVFGSRADAVHRHLPADGRLNPQSLYDYVYFHVIPSPFTVFENILKLPPASYLLLAEGRVEQRRYWDPDFCEQEPGSLQTLTEEMHSTLRQSVAHCHPDERTASFLSGGLDSSCVAGLFAEMQASRIRAYTVGFSADGYDEMEYARIAARHFDLDLREIYLEPDDITATMREIAAHYDEPFGNSSAVPALVCARRAAADGVHTMLAGDGGDELFGGNERYRRQQVFGFYDAIPLALRKTLVEPLVLGLPVSDWTPPTRKLRSYIEQARVPMPARLQTYNFLHRIAPGTVFEPGFLAAIDTSHPLRQIKDVYHAAPARSMLNRMLYLDWKFTLADNDLRKVSAMCELAGVAARFPLLDDELVELSTRVPPRLKLRGSTLRYFFKQSQKDFLPPEIIHKTKHGFGMPFGVWLRSQASLQQLVYASLDQLTRRGIVRAAFIDELIATHRGGHAHYYGDLVWVLVMLELWLEEHGVAP